MEELKVLLVDDEEDFVVTLVKRLKKRAVDVDGVLNGEEALAVLNRRPVDVVVLDVRMPGLDGIQVLKRVKEQHPLVEVVMLTGHADMDVAVQGMELGAFDYLMKPMDLDDLLYKIQDAYKKKSLKEKKIKDRAGKHGTTD